MKYIIDLERINELTAPHPGDNPTGYFPTSVHSISKMLIKKWVEIWEEKNSRSEKSEKVKIAFDNLRYNKILLTEDDIRDKKINHLLDESGEI
jgi:hypothetical protein